eukprot:gene11633-biopygen2679
MWTAQAPISVVRRHYINVVIVLAILEIHAAGRVRRVQRRVKRRAAPCGACAVCKAPCAPPCDAVWRRAAPCGAVCAVCVHTKAM